MESLTNVDIVRVVATHVHMLIVDEVDSSAATSACIKNSSKEFYNCVYHAAMTLGRDKRLPSIRA